MNFKNRLTAFLIVLLLPFVANADWSEAIRVLALANDAYPDNTARLVDSW